MKARVYQLIHCPKCNSVMYLEDSFFRCMNTDCKQYGIEYHQPLVNLKRRKK